MLSGKICPLCCVFILCLESGQIVDKAAMLQIQPESSVKTTLPLEWYVSVKRESPLFCNNSFNLLLWI